MSSTNLTFILKQEEWKEQARKNIQTKFDVWLLSFLYILVQKLKFTLSLKMDSVCSIIIVSVAQ